VVQGDEIWPVPKAEGEGVNPGGKKVAAYAWAHLECARSHAPDGELFTPVCPHWQKRGTCSFGALCFYDHPEALAKNQAGRATADASVPRRVGTWKRRVTRKSGKASIFRRWLIDHFGLELLSSGSGVLDVAGGKGEVAFELVNLNRIPTTVVDPRPLDLSSYKRKFEYGIYWRNPLMHIYIHPESSCETPVAAPKHLRVFFDDECLEAFSQASRRERMSDADQGLGGCELYDGKCWDGFFPSAVDRGHEVVWTKKGLIALDDLTEENSYPTRKRGGKEARVGGMEGQEKEGEGSEQADEAERPRGGDKVDGGWKKRSKDAGVPKHLRRERVRGVRPELRASRTERVGDEAGMDWALDAFASLTEVVGSSEEAVQEASAEEGEGEAGGEDGENAQGPEASGEVVTETDGEEVVDSSEALAVLDRSSVVIGLHPDQAVGSLVDFVCQPPRVPHHALTLSAVPWICMHALPSLCQHLASVVLGMTCIPALLTHRRLRTTNPLRVCRVAFTGSRSRAEGCRMALKCARTNSSSTGSRPSTQTSRRQPSTLKAKTVFCGGALAQLRDGKLVKGETHSNSLHSELDLSSKIRNKRS
jgi:hypothetical protein